jgi:hypothetical protein
MKTQRWMVLATVAGTVTLGVGACGDSLPIDDDGVGGSHTETPCNKAPFDCADGQTCWPNTNVTAFQCLNSGPGKKGDTCQLIGGQVSCADDLICLMAQGATMGVCTPYCDATDVNHGCDEGQLCKLYQINTTGLTLSACEPKGAGGAGGGPSTTSSTGSAPPPTSSSVGGQGAGGFSN